MFCKSSRKFFSVLEILASFTLIALVSVPMVLPVVQFTGKRKAFIEQMVFSRRSEVAWHSILRRETLDKFRLSWESFNAKEVHTFEWDEWVIPELGGGKYLVKVSFKRVCQTPKSKKGLPWKRIILVRLSIYKGSGVLVDVFNRSLILEKKNRLSQIDGIA